MNEIFNLIINQDKNSISWSFQNKDIVTEIENLDQAIYDCINKNILGLIKNSDGLEILKVISMDGTEISEFKAPLDFRFYYLATHPELGGAIVCVTEIPIDG